MRIGISKTSGQLGHMYRLLEFGLGTIFAIVLIAGVARGCTKAKVGVHAEQIMNREPAKVTGYLAADWRVKTNATTRYISVTRVGRPVKEDPAAAH